MTIQQGLESLLHEVETVLGTGKLTPQRLQYFEGARYYLSTLKAMVKPIEGEKKPIRQKLAGGKSE